MHWWSLELPKTLIHFSHNIVFCQLQYRCLMSMISWYWTSVPQIEGKSLTWGGCSALLMPWYWWILSSQQADDFNLGPMLFTFLLPLTPTPDLSYLKRLMLGRDGCTRYLRWKLTKSWSNGKCTKTPGEISGSDATCQYPARGLTSARAQSICAKRQKTNLREIVQMWQECTCRIYLR